MSKSNSRIPLLAALAAALAPAARSDSLWPSYSAGPHASMFADHKAQAVGDIVTIVVNENAVAQSTQSKTSNRTSSVNDAVTQFVYPSALSHAGQLPSVQTSGKAAYSGGGAINNAQSLTATAAVVVTDVLPNGNLVIEGRRIVTFSGETQYVALHGIIRAYDINPDDTIASANIANARLEFSSSGQLTDAEKAGWFSKLYEFLRPF
jgi:flagellar L-ring protein precursor FlgH